MSKDQIEKLLNFPRSRDNAHCCRIIDLYNEIVREMNHFYDDINAEINMVCKMSPRIFLYLNLIFLPSHIITRYIGDMYRAKNAAMKRDGFMTLL